MKTMPLTKPADHGHSPSSSRVTIALWIVVFLLGAANLFIRAYSTSLDNDEIEHMHASWLISQGCAPYVDFFDPHAPLLWYALSPLLRAFEFDAIEWIRLIMIGITCSCIPLLIYLARRMRLDASAALVIAGVFFAACLVSTRGAFQIRPEPMALFLLLSGLCFYVRERNWADAAFAGVLLGLSTLATPRSVFPIFGLFILEVLRMTGRRSIRLFPFLAGGLCLAVALIPLFMFGEDWANCLIRYNRLTRQSDALGTVMRAPAILLGVPLLLPLFFWGFADLWRKRRELTVFPVMALLGLLADQAAGDHLWRFHAPFLAIPAAWALSLLLNGARLWCVPVSLAVVLATSPWAAKGGMLRDHIAMLKQVADRIPRHEKVLVELYMHPVFRHDTAYFWAFGGKTAERLLPGHAVFKDILKNQPFALHVMTLKNYLSAEELQELMPLLNRHYSQEGPLLLRKTAWESDQAP